MLFSGRAYYNLLWLEKQRGQFRKSEPWESLDYRELSLDDLFGLLSQWDLSFDENSFIEFCLDLDAPEEFGDALELVDEENRRAYLVGFELWRRLLPEKISISLFCDELDRTIASYEKDRDSSKLFALLEQMIEILDRNDQVGDDAHVVFKRLCLYIAHDLENVIYTYVSSQIDDGVEGSYIDLLDHFMPYVKEKRALLFLKLKSMSEVFSDEKTCLMEYLVSSLQESVNSSLSVGMLFYLIERNQTDLFKELFSFLVYEATEESLLVTLLDVLMAYHQQVGQIEKKSIVSEFLQQKLAKQTKAKITKLQKNKVISLL